MKTLKFKLYRNKKNKLLHQQIDIAGCIWNHCIALQRRYYKLTGKYINVYAMQKHIAKIAKRAQGAPGFAHFALLGSQAVQDVCQRVDRSYQLFFKSKAGEIAQRFGRPSFTKVKKYSSCTLKQAGWKLVGANKIRIGKYIYKFSKSREILGMVKTVTIKRNKLGELFICFAVETVETMPDRLSNTIVGADFGLKTFLSLSTGEVIKSPEWVKTALRDIRKANRALPWKTESSRNWRKAQAHLQDCMSGLPTNGAIGSSS